MNSQESSPTPQFKSVNSLALSFPYSPTLTSIPDYWNNYNFSLLPTFITEGSAKTKLEVNENEDVIICKITADGDCSHEMKRRLLLGRKVMTNQIAY